jgi:hypothetical protein
MIEVPFSSRPMAEYQDRPPKPATRLRIEQPVERNKASALKHLGELGNIPMAIVRKQTLVGHIP